MKEEIKHEEFGWRQKLIVVFFFKAPPTLATVATLSIFACYIYFLVITYGDFWNTGSLISDTCGQIIQASYF